MNIKKGDSEVGSPFCFVGARWREVGRVMSGESGLVSQYWVAGMSHVRQMWSLGLLLLEFMQGRSGGLQKVRWGTGDRGKRGGVRVIYFWDAP